jgi:hypothetical protein
LSLWESHCHYQAIGTASDIPSYLAKGWKGFSASVVIYELNQEQALPSLVMMNSSSSLWRHLLFSFCPPIGSLRKSRDCAPQSDLGYADVVG